MSHISELKKISLGQIRQKYNEGSKLSMVTCYDSAFASLINHVAMDMVLVGDSMGNVVLGHKDTIKVTLDDMVHHTRAVSRVLQSSFLVSDLPFGSYQKNASQAFDSAVKLVQEGGAEAVKLEGGEEVCEQVSKIASSGIPVVGHLGLTPQSVHALGGYRVQGRGDEEADRLVKDAIALEKAGACMIVLELIPRALAMRVTDLLSIPTIGIGAGPETDGQVLVLHDLLGFNSEFKPKFLKQYANLGDQIVKALTEYVSDVSSGYFPTEENSFK